MIIDLGRTRELVYELFWRYLESTLEESILRTELSSIQKVISSCFVHFLGFEVFIHLLLMQCSVVNLYFSVLNIIYR